MLAVITVVVIVTVAVAVAYTLGWTGSNAGPAPLSPGSFLGAEEATITWSTVGGNPVPASSAHGPRETTNGLASGFSQDELGAVLAAINISQRITEDVGPAVYESTLRLQTFGDIEAALAIMENSISSSMPGEVVAIEYFYRIVGGDPNGDLAAIDIAARSIQSTNLGGYAVIPRTVQWVEGDWRVQVPAAPPRIVESVEGFTRLGGPTDAPS